MQTRAADRRMRPDPRPPTGSVAAGAPEASGPVPTDRAGIHPGTRLQMEIVKQG
jgi:hypothetical protein